MSATALAPTIEPGTIVDLGEHCPRRCVTWDVDDTCWGLERTRMKPRRPGTVPFRAVAPITDPEAWMAEPATLVALPAIPPPSPPRPPIAAAVAGEPEPDPISAVFGKVEVVYDLTSFRKRVGALLKAQRQRDPAVLDLPVWARLVEVAADESAEGDMLPVAARAVIQWCRESDPGRLKLGGWVKLVAQVEAFEGRWEQQSRLEPWVPAPTGEGSDTQP